MVATTWQLASVATITPRGTWDRPAHPPQNASFPSASGRICITVWSAGSFPAIICTIVT
jgi:hypothetical protein